MICGVGVGRKVKHAGCGSGDISYNRFSGVPMWWFLRRSKNKSRIPDGPRDPAYAVRVVWNAHYRANYKPTLTRKGIKITKWVHFSYGVKQKCTDIRTHLDCK